MCLVCKVLVDAQSDDVLTPGDYDLLDAASQGQVGRAEVAALLRFSDLDLEGLDLEGIDHDLVKGADLLAQMLGGSLRADELTRLIDTLDAERPDLVQHSAYILERDRRVHARQAAGV